MDDEKPEQQRENWRALVADTEEQPRSGEGPARPVVRFGDEIGDFFTVERVLGERNGRLVLVVHHTRVDRLFTMKLLPRELAKSARELKLFEEEAYAMSTVGHENIAYVTHFGESERFGRFYVMEYLSGETLLERLEREPTQPMEAVLNVALCVGSALAAVHELGFVHRDVRPANLMSARNDNYESWKLFEFGLSSRVVNSAEALELLTEPGYAAPEVACGEAISPRADQFSLAATLFRMLCGRPPWPGRTWTTATRADWTEPQVPQDLRSVVLPSVHAVLCRAMAPRPEDRFPSVEAFVASFQLASGHGRVATIPPIDAHEAAQVAKGVSGSGAAVRVGTSFGSSTGVVSGENTAPSVEVSVARLADMMLNIRMAFQSARRLRREWRRNMIGGGVFVPAKRRLEPNSPVLLTVEFAPTGAVAEFSAKVIRFVTGDTPGLALEVDRADQPALHDFIARLHLGDLDPSSPVTRTRAKIAAGELTSDEEFLLSRITEHSTVGRLRAICGNLPMDIDDTLARLDEKKVISIEGRELSSPRKRAMEAAPEEFRRLTLERVEYFRSQGNFRAAIETLQLATERQADAELHYQMALTKVQFLNDVAGGMVGFSRAVELDPSNLLYRRALEDLRKFE